MKKALKLFSICLFISNTMLSQSTSLDDKWNLKNTVWSFAHAQPKNKLQIGLDAIQNWKMIAGDVSISPNGKLFAYEIHRYPRLLDTLVVEALDYSWRQAFTGVKREAFRYKSKIAGASTGIFSADNKQYIYLDNKDLLCFLQIGSNECLYIKDVVSVLLFDDRNEWLACQLKNKDVLLLNLVSGKRFQFKEVSEYDFDGTGQWLICELGANNQELLLFNLATQKEQYFSSVKDYRNDALGKGLLLKIVSSDGSSRLKYVDLQTGDTSGVLANTGIGQVIGCFEMDGSGKQVIFCIEDTLSMIDNRSKLEIWYWRVSMNNAVMIVDNQTDGIDSSLNILGKVLFTENGRYIQFALNHQLDQGSSVFSAKKADFLPVGLDVWSYKDSALPSMGITPNNHDAIFDIEKRKLVYLTKDFEKITVYGDYGIITERASDRYGDRFWEKGYDRIKNWVVSFKDGTRKLLLDTKTANGFRMCASPRRQYLVYYDVEKGHNYFSYEFSSGKVASISSGIPNGLLGYRYKIHKNDEPTMNHGIAAWFGKDEGIIVYDEYDLWQLDLSGKKKPINITNGYGRVHKILFALMDCDRAENNPSLISLKQNDTLLIRAFNSQNKYNGFYRKIIGEFGNPELLSMEPCSIDKLQSEEPEFKRNGIHPLKSAHANVWIVKRQAADEAPNYFTTTDFKRYTRLTNFQPQKKYNWLTTELHSFKHLDKYIGQGLLYKPENFDPSKKYPVLIIFYGQYSDGVYQFPTPAFNWSPIAPALSPCFFLNNDYLVFTPDIYVSQMRPGPEAFNVIEGAAKYLKQLPYVDEHHIGSASHSWGAKLAAYVYTHSKELAGMVISEGFLYANPINMALSNDENGVSELKKVENGFEYGNLWQNKSAWLDQTTVLNVDKATMPLFLYCGKKSSKEYQNQTLQLFTAIRRLEKKGWWLNYDNGGHTVTGTVALDATIRFTQFFDHYLKEAPAPKWMTQGFSKLINGKKSRLELDPAGCCAADCKICKKWNEQYKKYPKLFEKSISEWSLYFFKNNNNFKGTK